MLVYGLGATAVVIGTNELRTMYGWDQDTASAIDTMPYIIAALMMPIVGLVADCIGKRAFLMMIGSLSMLFGHIFMLIHPSCDKCWESAIPFVCYGFSLTLYIVVNWGSLPLIVEPEIMSSAFGILSSC